MKSRAELRSSWILFFLLPAVLIGLSLPGCGGNSDKTPADAVPEDLGATNPPATGAVADPTRAAEATPPATQGTVEEVLARMVQAYKSAGSYRDAGAVQLSGSFDGRQEQRAFSCAVAMQRPNKIRMQIDNGTLLCDGVNTYGFVRDFPDQVLKIPAPAELSIESLHPDFLLATSMMQSPAQSFSWVPIQLVLLYAKDPMKTLTLDAQERTLIDPAMLDQYACDRVQLRTSNGVGVLWIDQATSVLRRFELPADALRDDAAQQQFVDVSLVVEFRDAQLNPPIAPEAFAFQLPSDINTVDALTLPLLRILGQPCPDFQFTDMEGNTISLSSLQGKVVVMELWTSGDPPCRPVLQAASKAYADLKNQDDVAMMALSLDGGNVQDASLQSLFKDWNVDLPIYRDRQQAIANHFGISGVVPLTIILDKKGNIQSFQPGGLENMDVLLARTIERLQLGQDVFQSAFQQFQENRSRFEALLKRGVAEDVYCLLPGIPRTEVSPRTEPANLKMSKLWTCDQLEQPGNITVAPSPGGPPRILVINGGKEVVELKTDGTVAATHPLELEGNELVMTLRTATSSDGRRYFLGTARGVQRIHLFDEGLKTILVYPDSEHPGIADAQMADLDGNGIPEIVIGYFSVAGVQATDLEGNRLWVDRSMSDAIRVATLAPGGDGRRNVLAMNGGPGGGTLVELDWQGKRLREITVPDCSVGWLLAEDLNGDGNSEICVLAQTLASDGRATPGEVAAMAIDLDGKVLWRHPLAPGVHFQQIEPVTTGNVFPNGPGQWLLATADSTISIVAHDGRMVDRFAYGAELAGMATAQWDGKVVLLVATSEAVEAWQIEPPASASTPVLPPPSN